MKKFLALAALSAVLAGPAAAADPRGSLRRRLRILNAGVIFRLKRFITQRASAPVAELGPVFNFFSAFRANPFLKH